MSVFDSSLYDTVPNMSAAGVIALIRATLVARKGVDYAPAHKALRRLREKGEKLRLVHAAVHARPEKVDRRLADLAIDRAWNAFEQRLARYAELGPEFAADQAEAAALHEVLFPRGTSFLSLPYAEQWTESAAIFHRIRTRELEGAINRFVGAPFLAQVRARHAAYGEALAITREKPEVTSEPSIIEPLREARAALTTYARTLATAVDNEEVDPKVAAAALAPIADVREQLRSAKKKDSKPVGDETELETETKMESSEPLPLVD